jgi:tetratricopeptide (TPR) repeat protein
MHQSQLEPKFAYPWNGLGAVYSDLDCFDEAIAAFQKSIELEPKFAYPWNGLGKVYILLKCDEEALKAFQKAVELDPDGGVMHSSLAGILCILGRKEEAEKQVEIARPLMKKESEYDRACFEAICGNGEGALRLLEIALEKKQTRLAFARRDPDFDFIRDDPRFKELVGEEGGKDGTGW